MRLVQAIFLGAAAALLTLAVPTLARNPDNQKHEQPASSSCHAYQQADDGSWTQLPCQEMGSKPTPQPKATSKNTDDEAR